MKEASREGQGRQQSQSTEPKFRIFRGQNPSPSTEPVRLDLQLKDRFGFGVEPREWFLIPLPIIKEAIQKLLEGTLLQHRYDLSQGRIVLRAGDKRLAD